MIAERLRLAGWDEPKADILGMVYRWLLDESNGRWTMVVDNADDFEVMFNPGIERTTPQPIPLVRSGFSTSKDRSLSGYLPSSTNGSIIITSRNRTVPEGLIEYEEDILELHPMNVNTAVDLFCSKLKRRDEAIRRADDIQLVQQLDCMPLAITQAAAYIKQRTPRVTVSTYLKVLMRSDFDRAKLLQVDIRDPRRDGQDSSSIITTWYISFEHVRRNQSSAARLLAFMSLFDPVGIPDYLLREQYSEGHAGQEDFEEEVTTLRALHLISIGLSDNLFDMHRLVQFSTKNWLELHGDLGRWKQQYVGVLSAAFPTSKYANWPICQALFPHVEVMMEYKMEGVDFLRIWTAVLYRAAWSAWQSGRYSVAERMARVSAHVRKEELSHDCDVNMESTSILGLMLCHQEKYKEAEVLNRQALSWSEEVLGVEHPDTLAGMSNLALALGGQEKYEEAEGLHRRALVASEKVLGVGDPGTLSYVNNLASVLGYQGKFKEAEGLHRWALAEGEKVHGTDHPSTLVSVANLASNLQHQGEYEEAEGLSRRALLGREKVLGVGHPDTLASVYRLASLLDAKQRWQEALDLYQRALAGSQTVFGRSHRTTEACQGHLTRLLEKMGRPHTV